VLPQFELTIGAFISASENLADLHF